MATDNCKVAIWLFSGGECRNGGDFRSAQIREILESNGIGYYSLGEGYGHPKFRARTVLMRFLMSWRLPTTFPHGLSRYVHDYSVCQKELKAGKKYDVIIWEATSEPSTIQFLRQIGRKIIAVPQNIESLGALRSPRIKKTIGFLSNELKGLSQADAVFTISREESWLLQLFGIRSNCLPFSPPNELKDRLRQVRKARAVANSFAGFISLGTVGNPPTRDGMIELIKMLEHLSPSDYGEFIFAGNGVDSLPLQSDPSRFIKKLGRISDEALDTFRSTAKALVICQRATTGALTRISEALHAGLPVIANYDAARGYTEVAGIHIYRNCEELRLLLNKHLPTPPIPDSPSYEISKFLEEIRS